MGSFTMYQYRLWIQSGTTVYSINHIVKMLVLNQHPLESPAVCMERLCMWSCLHCLNSDFREEGTGPSFKNSSFLIDCTYFLVSSPFFLLQVQKKNTPNFTLKTVSVALAIMAQKSLRTLKVVVWGSRNLQDTPALLSGPSTGRTTQKPTAPVWVNPPC